MNDVLDGVRDHYLATGLTERLKTALAVLGPGDQRLTPQQLAALDQFHTRGLPATAELAMLVGVTAGMSVFGRWLGRWWTGALSGRNLRLPRYGRRSQRGIRRCLALSDGAYWTERAGVV